MNLFLQAQPSFWNAPSYSGELWIKMLLGLAVGVGLIFALMAAPVQVRRPIVAAVTFISGLFYVLFYFWPNPVQRQDGQLPRDFVENVGFQLEDAVQVVVPITNILTALLLGLGIYSLFRIHFRKVSKMQRDWGFSLVLLGSMFAMIIFGYWDWITTHGPNEVLMESRSNWGFANYGRDLLFNGILQQMDAAMFSLIAFFILSAAYRAFRVRSVEATIMLLTALIMMLSLMGAVTYFVDTKMLGDPRPDSMLFNFTLTEIAKWIKDTFQTSSLRGIDFGVGIGALAMGLRLWLSLERQGAGA
jgi:hypothetical protein